MKKIIKKIIHIYKKKTGIFQLEKELSDLYEIIISTRDYRIDKILKNQEKNVEAYQNVIKKLNKKYPGLNISYDDSYKSIHRFNCYHQNKMLKDLPIKEFGDKKNVKETVLIEFRPLPNLEFVLRNTIIKLPEWNHTVVCGNINYDFIAKICENICKSIQSKINIIRLNIDKINLFEYNNLLKSKNFWLKIKGEKILLYQEDSVLFHSHIESFLDYDYIGAPWVSAIPKVISLRGGNGGFSLRTKSKMIECIEKRDPKDNSKFDSELVDHYNNVIPEDIYFSKTISDLSIGKLPSKEISNKFSQEWNLSYKPLGGHNFWYAESKKTNNKKLSYYRAFFKNWQSN